MRRPGTDELSRHKLPAISRIKRGWRLFAALALLPLSQTMAPHSANAAGPQMGGTVIWGENNGPFDSFIPIVSQAEIVDDEAQAYIFQPLLWVNQKVTIDYSQSIAKSVAASANNSTFTVTMNSNYKWSDGTPVTATDVQFCYNLMKQYGTKYAYYGIGGLPNQVKSFTVNSPTSFTIVMNQTFNPLYFELNGLAQLRPLPSKAWAGKDATYLLNHETDLATLSVVDGPYKLTKFVTGQYAQFERNTTFAGHQSYLDTFIVKFYSGAGSTQAEFADLKSGAIQIGVLDNSLWKSRAQLGSLSSYDFSLFGFSYIELNYRNPKTSFFKDQTVRQALQMAINQEEMNQTVYYGNAHDAYSPIPFSPATYLTATAKATSPLAFNLAKAGKMLDADGWKMVGGVRQKAGQKLAFTITVISGSATGLLQAEIMQQDYAKLGVTINLVQQPFGTVIATLGKKGADWDAVSIGWIYYPNFYPLGDGLFGTTGGANFGGFSDTKLDATITESQTKPGLKGIHDYGDYAAKAVPALYLDYPSVLIRYSPKVQGIAQFFSPIYAFSPQYLWLSK
jgi:peptide/nickel transport system substrate-binding protein